MLRFHDGSGTVKRADYDKQLARHQHAMVLLQNAYVRQGCKGIVLLEGWDASGKGGIIRRIGWALDPRALRVWSIGPPTPQEHKEHWLQRFWRRVPPNGEIAVFDRSWYGRVLVERIEGFATQEEWRRAYREIDAFETALVDGGVRLVKLFLDITPETQLARFRDRYERKEKRWKLTEDDIRNRARWDQYQAAYDEMRQLCSPPHAPWVTIDANDKHKARLTALETILETLGDGIDTDPPDVSLLIKSFFDNR